MAGKLADTVAEKMSLALSEKGKAALAVSGGSTPGDLYRLLSKKPLDWKRVSTWLVDERWVEPGDALSNESFVRRTLAQNAAHDVEFEGLWTNVPSFGEAAAAASDVFLRSQVRFDVVVLGIGIDGHTASWFPHSQGLGEALSDDRKICAIRAIKSEVTGECVERLTMSLGAIVDAGLICLVMAGEDKRVAYRAAIEDGPVEDMPVRAILNARSDTYVCWAP